MLVAPEDALAVFVVGPNEGRKATFTSIELVAIVEVPCVMPIADMVLLPRAARRIGDPASPDRPSSAAFVVGGCEVSRAEDVAVETSVTVEIGCPEEKFVLAVAWTVVIWGMLVVTNRGVSLPWSSAAKLTACGVLCALPVRWTALSGKAPGLPSVKGGNGAADGARVSSRRVGRVEELTLGLKSELSSAKVRWSADLSSGSECVGSPSSSKGTNRLEIPPTPRQPSENTISR